MHKSVSSFPHFLKLWIRTGGSNESLGVASKTWHFGLTQSRINDSHRQDDYCSPSPTGIRAVE